jgi:NAD(P)-dependent dehydrogenase (short-subunit alcohol dehydrogenase family)
MDLRLAGKRVLVTGSSAGLGEAIAKFLAAERVTLVVHGRDVDRTNAVAQAIHTTGGRAEIVIGDLSTDHGADAVASAALAGGGDRTGPRQTSSQGWRSGALRCQIKLSRRRALRTCATRLQPRSPP